MSATPAGAGAIFAIAGSSTRSLRRDSTIPVDSAFTREMNPSDCACAAGADTNPAARTSDSSDDESIRQLRIGCMIAD